MVYSLGMKKTIEFDMSRKVSYFYDNEVGSFYYGQEHPMKPFRIKMAHQLIVNYGLYRRMNCYVRKII